MAQEKYSEAIKDYQFILRTNPENTEALGNLGIACMLAGRPMEAMIYFEKTLALEKDPEWRMRIEKLTEKLLQDPKLAKKQAPAAPVKLPAGPVKNLW